MKKFWMVCLAFALAFSLVSCGDKTDTLYQPPQKTPVPSATMSPSPGGSPTPSIAPTASPTATPTATPTHSPAQTEENWSGNFVQAMGSAEQVSLTISEVKEDSFSFSMEAKSIVFSGKTARTGNSATYNGKDGTLSFILNN
ncbi:MAG: hypothetical protein RR075_04475, partial [Pygmaiobacter sp.]